MTHKDTSHIAYAEHLRKRYPVVWLGKTPWWVFEGVLESLAMPHIPQMVAHQDVQRVLRSCHARMARWSDDWDIPPCSWWWCCARGNYEVEKFPSKRGRRDVRAGLRRCTVEPIPSQTLAEKGFAVYQAAFSRYNVPLPMNEHGFRDEVLWQAQYTGRESWGCFVNGTLVAYASCVIVDQAVNVNWLKFDPDYSREQPNSALMYTLTRHYLHERNLLYVADGCRSLHHETSFQKFLERMGYEKIYCPLHVEVAPHVALASNPHIIGFCRRFGMNRWSPSLIRRMEAVHQLRVIASEFEKPPSAGK